MPVRNGARWLHEAAASSLNQNYSDFELLIVDDGSSDNTPKIAAEFQRMDSRVRVIQQDQLGLVAALNRGLSEAKGSFIARLDADDVAFPNRLERQVAYFDSHPSLVLLGSWAQKIDEAGGPIGMLRPESESEKLKTQLLKKNPFIHSSVVFSADAARQCGGYRKVFEAAEDFDLWLQLSERGDIAIVPEVLIKYRVHQQSVSANLAIRQLFSSRLAIRSAMARRSGRADPLENLSSPPDWNEIENGSGIYADAKIFQLLQYSAGLKSPGLSVAEIRAACAAPLTHAERKIAQVALLNVIRGQEDLPLLVNAELLARMFCLHPTRALKLLWTNELRGRRTKWRGNKKS